LNNAVGPSSAVAAPPAEAEHVATPSSPSSNPAPCNGGPRCRISVSAPKAVWGYDPEFMALMPAALGVAREDITAGDVWVATGADGQIAGVVALAPGDAPGALDLNKLFVEPRHIRGGVGRALLAHAAARRR
jgi:hypothetical protein